MMFLQFDNQNIEFGRALKRAIAGAYLTNVTFEENNRQCASSTTSDCLYLSQDNMKPASVAQRGM